MKTYTVSASLGDLFEVIDFLETDDKEATIKAIHTVLSNACNDKKSPLLQNLWVNGKIVFADEEGNVIRTMNAYEGADV